MNQIGQNFFWFFVGEVVSLLIALSLKDNKRKMLFVFLIGTVISGIVGFGWELKVAASELKDVDILSNIRSMVQQSPAAEPTTFNQEFENVPRVTLIGGSDISPYLDTTKALGELAEEKYSLTERNEFNRTLTFTINLRQSQPVVWRWYWCATTRNILDQNMKSLNVEFILNGENVTNEFYGSYFQFKDAPMKGWSCFTYQAVLIDWESGVHYLEQNVTNAQQISDGQDIFPSGFKTYQYTIRVQ